MRSLYKRFNFHLVTFIVKKRIAANILNVYVAGLRSRKSKNLWKSQASEYK